MRLLPTTIVLLSALYATAQPANQGQILACSTAITGAQAASTLEENDLPPPKDMSLLVGEFCEPLMPHLLQRTIFPGVSTHPDVVYDGL